MLIGIVLALDLHVAELFLGVGTGYLERGYPVDHIDGEAEPVDLILDGQFQRSVDVPFLLVATHVHVPVIRPAVGQAMDQPRVTMECEDDGLVDGENTVEIPIR